MQVSCPSKTTLSSSPSAMVFVASSINSVSPFCPASVVLAWWLNVIQAGLDTHQCGDKFFCLDCIVLKELSLNSVNRSVALPPQRRHSGVVKVNSPATGQTHSTPRCEVGVFRVLAKKTLCLVQRRKRVIAPRTAASSSPLRCCQ